MSAKFLLIYIILFPSYTSGSATVPSFIYSTEPEPVTENVMLGILKTLSWEHVIFMFVFINTLFLLLIVLRYTKISKAPRLILEVTSTNQCIFIPVMKLPLCPSHSSIQLPDNISELSISDSWIFPKLHLTWSCFTVEHELTEQVYSVPSKLPLSLLQKNKLKKILKKPFFVHLHSEHGGYLSQIPMSSSIGEV